MTKDNTSTNVPNEADKPAFLVGAVIDGFSIVAEDKEFKFKGLCPYCQGDLTYRCNGWEQDENGLWMADSFDMECSTEPDMESEEWEDWMDNHSDMPYIHQLPVDERVKASINKRYRFDVR
jgi:hypothetical protein